ncbi:MAG: c-type cytochrome [Candidatus Acidiferrales bacterium]
MRAARWFLFLIIVLAAVGLGFWAVARAHGKSDWPVPEEAKKVKNPVAVTPEGLAAAREIYFKKCSQCHGDAGKGDGDQADMYDPRPANLSNGHMMSAMTDGEIFYKISEGHDPMPSFKKKFSDEDRWRLVNFVRTFTGQQGTAGQEPDSSHHH